jgi:hypothetical protein
MENYLKKLKQILSDRKRRNESLKEKIQYEHAIHDSRIMFDGRPAYAWWNEIQMLRAREPKVQQTEKTLLDKMKILKIVEWAYTQPDVLSNDIVVRIKTDYFGTNDPHLEFLKDPGKFCTLIK